MRTRSSLIALFAIACGSSGSQTAGNAPQPITQTTRVTSGGQIAMTSDQSRNDIKVVVNAPLSKVWSVLPSVYSDLGVTVTMSDSVNHVFGNTGTAVRQKIGGTMVTRYFDCGGGSSALSYDLFVTTETQAQPIDGKTTSVSTNVKVKGKPMTYSGDWVSCESLGLLERRIQEAIATKAAQ